MAKKWYVSADTAATETQENVTKPLTETCVVRRVSATVSYVYAAFPFTDSWNFALWHLQVKRWNRQFGIWALFNKKLSWMFLLFMGLLVLFWILIIIHGTSRALSDIIHQQIRIINLQTLVTIKWSSTDSHSWELHHIIVSGSTFPRESPCQLPVFWESHGKKMTYA